MVDERWYKGKPEALPWLVKRLEDQALSTQRFLDGSVTRLYFGEGVPPSGTQTDSTGLGRASNYLRAFDGLSQENLVKSVLQGAASMIVRKPAVKVVTSGSSWKKQVAARRMSRLLTGVFSSAGLEAATNPVFLDSCRCSVAAVKWSIDETGKILCERALPHTISYNPAAGPNPRELYQHHGVPRSELLARYPEKLQGKDDKLPAYRPDPAFTVDAWSTMADQDLCDVYEAWRLPKGKDPGRYVLVCGSEVLEDEEWDLPVFPLVILTFGDSYNSLAGDPLGRQILPFQLKQNRMNRAIDENATKCANPRMTIPMGAEVKDLTTTMGEIVYYNSAAGPISWLPGQMLPPQYYQEKEANKRAAFEFAGVSQSVATATKSAGLNSGRAQRDEYDRASGRLIQDAEKLERWYERNAMTALALMRKAYASKAKRLQAPNTKILEEIDWTAIGDLKEDEIEVRCYITSSIPNTPAGRAETLAERVEAGVMTQRRADRWYADPDTARLEDEDSAAEDFALKAIDSCLIDSVYVPPEPVLGTEGLQTLIDLAGAELLKAIVMPEPPDEASVELLRRLIEEAKLLLQPAAPPANDNAAPAAPQAQPAQAQPAA